MIENPPGALNDMAVIQDVVAPTDHVHVVAANTTLGTVVWLKVCTILGDGNIVLDPARARIVAAALLNSADAVDGAATGSAMYEEIQADPSAFDDGEALPE